jgi:hypothetical protein
VPTVSEGDIKRIDGSGSALAGATTPIDIIPTINEITASHNELCLILNVILKNLSLTLSDNC